MSNALVRLNYTLDIPENVLERLVGSPDDGSQAWHELAWDTVKQAVEDNPSSYMEYATTDAEVEVTM